MILPIAGDADATCYSESMRTTWETSVTRTSISRSVVVALALCLIALTGCERERSQPGPKPISGHSAAVPGAVPATPSSAPAAPR